MKSQKSKIALAAVVSFALLALVLYFADFQSFSLNELRPQYAMLSVAAFLALICLRALSYAVLANQPFHKGWLRLANLHQLVFMLAPSGLGDLAFPGLAKKFAGQQIASSVRALFSVRLRDVLMLLTLGGIGLVGIGKLHWIFLAGPLACILVSLFLDRFLQILLVYISRYFPRFEDKIRAAITETSLMQQVRSTILSAAVWLAWALALYGAFQAANWQLGMFEVFVMLAGMNVAGALAVSVAGLGVSELGAAGVLVFLGVPLAKAATLSVIARPVLLAAAVMACLILEALHRSGRFIRN